MEINIDELSPMMKRYFQIKANYPDCLLFFRLGDFYEMFFDDAETASRVLDLTLTGRDCGLKDSRAPMCGVPYHAVDNYVRKLIDAGFRVAICEQLSDPATSKGLVDRDVVRVITPGTVMEEQILDERSTNYLASVFSGDRQGYPPCTAQACMELLDYYGYDLTGRRAVVVGRSLVIGRPAAMLLLGRNATVTLCHTRTADLAAECRRAEVLIAAAGKAKVIGADHLAPGQVVIDVGINVDEDGSLTGDVDFAAAQDVVRAITPVPGGVGAVTTTVLARHVLEAAARASGLTLSE